MFITIDVNVGVEWCLGGSFLMSDYDIISEPKPFVSFPNLQSLLRRTIQSQDSLLRHLFLKPHHTQSHTSDPR